VAGFDLLWKIARGWFFYLLESVQNCAVNRVVWSDRQCVR